MTERQDNGLLSLFSVLASPPLALPLVLVGQRISLLVLPHDFFDSGQTKGPEVDLRAGFLKIDELLVLFPGRRGRGRKGKKSLQSNGRTVKACRVSSGYRVHRPDDVCLLMPVTT